MTKARLTAEGGLNMNADESVGDAHVYAVPSCDALTCFHGRITSCAMGI